MRKEKLLIIKEIFYKFKRNNIITNIILNVTYLPFLFYF